MTTPREDPARQAYGRLHGRAMVLNAITALLGAGTLVLVAFEPRLLGSAERGTRSAEQGRVEEVAERLHGESLPARARS